jgi:hypothetical protein
MTESQLYELIAQKQRAVEELARNYGIVVSILRGVKDGTIDVSRVTVTADNNVTLAAPVLPVAASEQDEAA